MSEEYFAGKLEELERNHSYYEALVEAKRITNMARSFAAGRAFLNARGLINDATYIVNSEMDEEDIETIDLIVATLTDLASKYLKPLYDYEGHKTGQELVSNK